MPLGKDAVEPRDNMKYTATGDPTKKNVGLFPALGADAVNVVQPDAQKKRPTMRGAGGDVGTASRYGARESFRGTAGLIDLVGKGLDFISPYDPSTGEFGFSDPATGFGASEYVNEVTEGMAPPNYEPQGQAEQLAALAANAGASFAIPGGAGLGTVRAIPGAMKATSGGMGQAARAYGKGVTTNVGENAARLGASNVAGSGVGQAFQANEVDNMPMELAASMIAGGGADLGVGRMARQARGGGKAIGAARNPKNNLGGTKTNSLGHLVDGIRKRLGARMGDAEYSDRDLVEARDSIMQVLFGRLERVTQKELDEVLETQGMQAHQQRKRLKEIQDDVFNELEFYATQYDNGIATPSLIGILRGSDLQNNDIETLAKLQSRGQFSAQSRAVQELAQERQILDTEALRPAGATGDPADVQGAAIESQVAAKARVDEPYESPPAGLGNSEMKELLDGAEGARAPGLRIKPANLRKVFKNALRDTDLTPQAAARVGLEKRISDLLETPDFVNPDGTISLSAYDGIRQDAQAELRNLETPDSLKPFLMKLIDKVDKQIERRLRRSGDGTYEKYIENRRAYAEYMDTFGEKMTPNERGRIDSRNSELTSGVAKSLLSLRGSVKEGTGDMESANDLLKMVSKHDVRSVAAQVRKVMAESPNGMDEVEATIFNRIFNEALDPTSTQVKVKNAQTNMRGRRGEESDLMALYREIAGDSKADDVPDLIKRARAARGDMTWDGGEAHRPNSSLDAQLSAEASSSAAGAARDLAAGNFGSGTAGIVRMVFGKHSTDVSEQRLANAIQVVQLNPRALLELMEAPSTKSFENWKSKYLGKPGRAGVRETAKRNLTESETE